MVRLKTTKQSRQPDLDAFFRFSLENLTIIKKRLKVEIWILKNFKIIKEILIFQGNFNTLRGYYDILEKYYGKMRGICLRII